VPLETGGNFRRLERMVLHFLRRGGSDQRQQAAALHVYTDSIGSD